MRGKALIFFFTTVSALSTRTDLEWLVVERATNKNKFQKVHKC